MVKVVCELCGAEISKSNYSKHLRRHEEHPETFVEAIYKLTHEGLSCQFCGKECKNKNSLCNHERLCKENPNRQESSIVGFNNFGKEAWNKGKTAKNDPRVAQGKETYNRNKLLGKHKPCGHKHTEEYKKKQREVALARGLGGFAWRKGIYYNGIKLDSSYEVIVAESLDANNIRWIRPKRLPYHWNDKLHYYTPDFYLPDYDIYLDPKNDFLINNVNPVTGIKDSEKIKQVEVENKLTILILDKNNLTWDKIKLNLTYVAD